MSHTAIRANPLRSAGWLFLVSLLMLVIAVGVLIFVGRMVLTVRSQVAALDTVNAMLVLEDAAEDGSPVTLDDFLEVAGRVEAAEERAVGSLSVFEAIAFVTSVLGLLVVGLGIFAAVVGVGNYASLLNQLEEASAKLQDSQATLDTLRTEREHIEEAISSGIQAEWRSAHLALSLLPLAERSYRSLVLQMERRPEKPESAVLPRITVERRPLATYARIAAGGR